jgi:hypothetical protein
MENKRSNMAQESIGWANIALGKERNEQGWQSLAIEQHKADSSRLQAESSASQARSAALNAATNARKVSSEIALGWAGLDLDKRRLPIQQQQADAASRQAAAAASQAETAAKRQKSEAARGWASIASDFITESRKARNSSISNNIRLIDTVVDGFTSIYDRD